MRPLVYCGRCDGEHRMRDKVQCEINRVDGDSTIQTPEQAADFIAFLRIMIPEFGDDDVAT